MIIQKHFIRCGAFLEEHVPCVSGSVIKRTHANFFAPRELANYHVDDEGDDAWTFMFYANNNWEINQGGETKFITNLKEEFNKTRQGSISAYYCHTPNSRTYDYF